MKYHVEFELDGKKKVVPFHADNPGAAFSSCLKSFPLAKLISAEARGRVADSHGFTVYLPPPVVRQGETDDRPAGELKPDDRSCVLPFYDEVVRPDARPF